MDGHFFDWLDALKSLLLKTSHAYQKHSYATHPPTPAPGQNAEL
jgi:hypothetical protein